MEEGGTEMRELVSPTAPWAYDGIDDDDEEERLEVYRCKEVALARSGVGFKTTEVDKLPIGTMVVALESRVSQGVQRIRTTCGWISVTAVSDGEVILERVEEEELRSQLVAEYLAAQPVGMDSKISATFAAVGEMTRDVVVGLVDNLVGGAPQAPVGTLAARRPLNLTADGLIDEAPPWAGKPGWSAKLSDFAGFAGVDKASIRNPTAQDVMGGRQLHSKVAIITGASSGIGLEVARVLCRAGARVVLACRDERKAMAAAAEIQAGLSNERETTVVVGPMPPCPASVPCLSALRTLSVCLPTSALCSLPSACLI